VNEWQVCSETRILLFVRFLEGAGMGVTATVDIVLVVDGKWVQILRCWKDGKVEKRARAR
jgi:hypothetical protein